MTVRDLEAGDLEPHPRRVEGPHLGLPDGVSNHHQVSRQLRIEVQPVVDRGARDDDGMAGGDGVDREKGDASVVGPYELRGQLAVDDAAEDRGHGPIVVLAGRTARGTAL